VQVAGVYSGATKQKIKEMTCKTINSRKTMKNFFVLFCGCLMCVTAITGCASKSGTAGNLSWKIVKDTLTISGTGAIPDYSYSPISHFYNVTTAPWGKHIKLITTIVIADSVTSIGEAAFVGCRNLMSIVIPNSVTKIGNHVFYQCENLTTVTIPKSVMEIGEYAFWECSGLSSITIPNSVTEIRNYTFWQCSSLASVTIPNSVTKIGEDAFENCHSLTSITIPKSITKIEKGVFDGCQRLTSVIIPKLVTEIGAYAFWDCRSLKSVTIPSSVRIIGDYAFHGCDSLASVNIPNSVKEIGAYAFTCCSLTSITIPSSVTVIGKSAFAGSSLTSINVAENNKAYSSEDGVLFNKDKTSLIQFPESKRGEYIIPNSVTEIGECAFRYCKRLTSLTIPNSVTTIGEKAFDSCRGLTEIINEATVPQKIKYEVLFDVNAALFVPADALSAYLAAAEWQDLDIYAITENPDIQIPEDDELGNVPENEDDL